MLQPTYSSQNKNENDDVLKNLTFSQEGKGIGGLLVTLHVMKKEEKKLGLHPPHSLFTFGAGRRGTAQQNPLNM